MDKDRRKYGRKFAEEVIGEKTQRLGTCEHHNMAP